MGAVIEAVATSRSRGRLLHRGAIALADRAARTCLERAGKSARDVDFLINAGVYRDHNFGEPAIAAMIQEDIGANPDPPLEGGHGTFSLDVANGGCGVLTAMQILDGFLASGAIGLGLVVAADAPPEGPDRRAFPFASAGGAALLRHADDGGFVRFATTTHPEHIDLFQSWLEWEPAHGPRLQPGRHRLEIVEHPDYPARCAEKGAEAAAAFLREAGLGAGDIDLCVASPTPASFPRELAAALGIAQGRMASIDPELAGVHSAGPIAALEQVLGTARWAEARNVLFCTVGAGITVGLALYAGGRDRT